MSKLDTNAHAWYREYNWFLRNVGRIRSGDMDLAENFPLLLKGSSPDRLYALALEIHQDVQRRYERTRNRGRKPKMFPIIPRSQQFASPEVILLYLESLNNV